LLVAAGARAAEDAPPPQVDLERLLRLPRSYDASVPRYGGATQVEWRERFAKAQRDLDLASVALEEVEEELKSMANESSQWQVSAPGQTQSSETSPLSFRLREEIRRQREEVARAQKRERSLDIEADLADVPEEWRE
jgi:predicted  nucleic acid-binding Zn-ribbon protein